MDWSKIKRKQATVSSAKGVYADLDELIRIQFKVRDFSFKPRQPISSVLSGRYASRLRGRGLNFEELRRYLPGDDIRTIDWKVTARSRKPHVRVYTEEKDRQVLLVVDQRMNMFFGSKRQLKSCVAAELTALGAWRAIESGDRVGAILFNDSEIKTLQPKRSKANVMSILKETVLMNHALRADSKVQANPSTLNIALQKALQLAPHDVLVVIISDFFGCDDTTRKLTAAIANHNDVIGFLVIDPTRNHPSHQSISASDGEMQIEIDFSDSKVRETIGEDYLKEQQAISHFLRQLSAPLLPITTSEDVVKQVRKLLGVAG